MKIKEIARITEDKNLTRELEAKPKRKIPGRDAVRQYVLDHPGESVREVLYALNGKDDPGSYVQRYLSSVLNSLYKQGEVDRKRLDGKFRWYPTEKLVKPRVVSYFRCPECQKDLPTKKALTMHQMRMHTEAGLTGYRHRGQSVIMPATRPQDSDLTAKAKEYIWETNNGDDLAAVKRFIEWMGGES